MPDTDFNVVRIALDAITARIDEVKTDMEAVTEAVSHIGRDQAVFEYKHDQAQRVSDKLEQIVDRISEKGEDELRNTIEMLDKREEKLTDSIVTHREVILREVALQHQTIKQSIDTLTRDLGDLAKMQSADRKEFLIVQKWMWTLAGAIGAVSILGEKILDVILG